MSLIERAGRTCYKSEGIIDPFTTARFIKNLIARGHESVLEHVSITVRFICDRGVSHELVRHRLASYSQESTRYCHYGKLGMCFIAPVFFDVPLGTYRNDGDLELILGADRARSDCKESVWLRSMLLAEKAYCLMLAAGARPEEARTVLPNSLKTEVVCTMNVRAWRHFFDVRTLGLTGRPHPQMLELTTPLLAEFAAKFPACFADQQTKF
jgi:thymidylate synthase (FAD)